MTRAADGDPCHRRGMPVSRPLDPPAEPIAGRYQLLDRIGAGGMGVVWRAWDLREQRFMAVKLLHRTDAPDLLRFVQEQAVRIDHPHVAAPTGWVADDDRVAFAMPLARGGTVADLLGDHGPFAAPYAAELVGQLLDGLAAVHAAGVVHRDLKPANLLLEPTGRGVPRLRIGDFGVAAVLAGPRPGDGLSVGTAGYAAPEQLAGAPPDPRQDLYAVGVVTRVLLGGGARPVGPLAPFVAALTEPDPARRPACAAEAAGLLARCRPPRLGGRPEVPDRLGAAAVPLPRARRPRHVRRSGWAGWAPAVAAFPVSGVATGSAVYALLVR